MIRVDKQKSSVAVIGYGSQGRAIAQNLRDSGFAVIVGLRSRSKSRRVARVDGMNEIMRIGEAVSTAQTIIFAFPDHLHARVYAREIAPHLRPRCTLVFLHGLSIHFSQVNPPTNCDVILIAPHAPGRAVREKYLGDRSVSAFYAVHQNRSKKATATTARLAKGIGIRRASLVKTTFAHETLGDLFGEQAVLCGGLSMLIKHGFETLVERGLKPEHAWLEVAHQLDLIIDLIKQHGIAGMFARISVAARFGSLQAGPKLLPESTKNRMGRIFDRIESGQFARQLSKLEESDIAELNKQLATITTPQLEQAARKIAAKR